MSCNDSLGDLIDGNSLLSDKPSQQLFVGRGQVLVIFHLDAGSSEHGHSLRVLQPEGRVEKLEWFRRELGVHSLDLLAKIVSQPLQIFSRYYK